MCRGCRPLPRASTAAHPPSCAAAIRGGPEPPVLVASAASARPARRRPLPPRAGARCAGFRRGRGWPPGRIGLRPSASTHRGGPHQIPSRPRNAARARRLSASTRGAVNDGARCQSPRQGDSVGPSHGPSGCPRRRAGPARKIGHRAGPGPSVGHDARHSRHETTSGLHRVGPHRAGPDRARAGPGTDDPFGIL
jgi:hypothetical protein